MAMIRPSLTLVLDLDERLATEQTILEIKRSYAHITTPVIRKHEPVDDGTPVNIARLLVNMGAYSYLSSEDEGADERWRDVVEPWIGNILHKVGNNLKVFNDRQRELGMPELLFDRANVELGAGKLVVSIHPDPVCWIDPSLNEKVGLARELFNAGAFEGASIVRMPSERSWEVQHSKAWDEWVEEHPEALLEPESAQTLEEDAESEPEKTREQLLLEDIEAKSYENTAVPPTDSDALPAPKSYVAEEPEPEPERFSFEVDYSVWEVEFEDGSTRLFDPAKRAFADGLAG